MSQEEINIGEIVPKDFIDEKLDRATRPLIPKGDRAQVGN